MRGNLDVGTSAIDFELNFTSRQVVPIFITIQNKKIALKLKKLA